MRLFEGLDRDPDSAPLSLLQVRLLAEHPDPEAYRAWLANQLESDPKRPAAAVIRPLLL